ncbi:hypothetical protein B0H66DRAFT_641179 [Apodospora peruviana]|uniref:Uncharacterized protein n=1 Tax=Apodospora peruviana TaxID=516989 RepID=A0AAE0I0M3_9PEZI|nr:hypothetical protein B0H66DRAFT_641179 [Apodospora peruviana]
MNNATYSQNISRSDSTSHGGNHAGPSDRGRATQRTGHNSQRGIKRPLKRPASPDFEDGNPSKRVRGNLANDHQEEEATVKAANGTVTDDDTEAGVERILLNIKRYIARIQRSWRKKTSEFGNSRRISRDARLKRILQKEKQDLQNHIHVIENKNEDLEAEKEELEEENQSLALHLLNQIDKAVLTRRDLVDDVQRLEAEMAASRLVALEKNARLQELEEEVALQHKRTTITSGSSRETVCTLRLAMTAYCVPSISSALCCFQGV